jgi:hypothetical protein
MGARLEINSPVNFSTNYYFGLSQPRKTNPLSPILTVSPGGNVYDLTGYLNFRPKRVQYGSRRITVHEATIPQKAKLLFGLFGQKVELVVKGKNVLPYQHANPMHQVFFMTSLDAIQAKQRLQLELAVEGQDCF